MIDGEEVILKSIKIGLGANGFKVATAQGGIDALEYLAKHHTVVGLVLLDIMMPDMNGIGVLKIIKKKYPKIKVIMLSGLVGQEEIAEAKSLGANGFLQKPYKIEEIFSHIST